MAMPLSYNLRNLAVRKTSTLMTALGIALTVAVLLAVLALVEGLRQAFRATGNPQHVLVTRSGSESELTSNFTREQFQVLKDKPGVARDATGEPMASLEMVTVLNLESVDAPNGINITLRGVTPMGLRLRDGLRLTRGRWFAPGQREMVVGKAVARRNPSAALGGRVFFGRGYWTVVGIMDAGESAVNGEIWADLNLAAADDNRLEVLSSSLVRAESLAAVPGLLADLKDDQRLNVLARTERAYYEAQTSSAAPIQFLGVFVAVIMAVGSSFAAMNTMYAAVARRSREVGTLRVLGFSQSSILLSFLVESLLLSLLGGLLGCLLVLPLNNLTTGIGSFTTFSEVAFNLRVTPGVMAAGVAFALGMGAIGGLFPAFAAARKEILVALRDV